MRIIDLETERGQDDLTPRPGDTFPHYVIVGRRNRAYGGPEEGGWWYDHSHETLAAILVESETESKEVVKKLEENEAYFDPGTGEYVINIFHSFTVPDDETFPKPHYE